MKKILLLGLIIISSLLLSCSNDSKETGNDAKATLRLKPQMELELENIVTRAPELSSFTLILDGPDGEESMPFPTDGEVTELTPGEYTVTITSHPDGMPDPDFETPYYYVSETTTLAPGEDKEMDMTVTQANAGVYFDYSDPSLAASGLENIIPTVTQETTPLEYKDANKEAKGYFAPGTVNVSFKNNGEVVTINNQSSTPITVEANDLWKITLKVTVAPTDGSITISAVIANVNDRDEEIILDIPDVTPPTGDVMTFTGLESTALTFTMHPSGETVSATVGADGLVDISALAAYSGQVIKSVTPDGGAEAFIGREAGEEFSVKFADGAIVLRDADENGYVPISVSGELFALAAGDATVLGGKFLQDANIDFSGVTTFPGIGKWATTAAGQVPLSGTYDGGFFEIRNLNRVFTANYGGIFAGVTGTVTNVKLMSGTLNVRDYSGGIAGYVAVGGVVSNCYNGASIVANNNIYLMHIGGICGTCEGSIVACHNAGSVTGGSPLGGVAGYVRNYGSVTASKNTGTIQTSIMSANIGGITGYLMNGKVNSSFSAATVRSTGSSPYTGGISPYANQAGSQVANCYWSGTPKAVEMIRNSATVETTYYFNDGTTVPDGLTAGWPTEDASKGWGIYETTTEGGYYWKSLGEDGTTNYPLLWWE